MTASEYPKREPFFANRFVRLMTRTCLGARIGPDGFALLTIIAMTEDAKRYSGAVTFFNQNLADQLGCSVSALDRTRKKAVDEGWLHYECGLRNKAGKYWVIIPECEEGKSDTPLGEELPRQLPTQFDEATEIVKLPTRLPTQFDEATGRQPTTLLPMPLPNPKDRVLGTPVQPAKSQPEQNDTNFDPVSAMTSSADRGRQTFAEFWSLYPNKQREQAARMCWNNLVLQTGMPDDLFRSILAAVRSWLPEWETVGVRRVPHAANWIREERWTEKPPGPDTPSARASPARAKDEESIEEKITRAYEAQKGQK